MEKTHLLEVLKEIHSTQQLVNHIFSKKNKKQITNMTINPLDMFHDFLKVDLKVMDRND